MKLAESDDEKQLVARINELAHKARAGELTEEETVERKKIKS